MAFKEERAAQRAEKEKQGLMGEDVLEAVAGLPPTAAAAAAAGSLGAGARSASQTTGQNCRSSAPHDFGADPIQTPERHYGVTSGGVRGSNSNGRKRGTDAGNSSDPPAAPGNGRRVKSRLGAGGVPAGDDDWHIGIVGRGAAVMAAIDLAGDLDGDDTTKCHVHSDEEERANHERQHRQQHAQENGNVFGRVVVPTLLHLALVAACRVTNFKGLADQLGLPMLEAVLADEGLGWGPLAAFVERTELSAYKEVGVGTACTRFLAGIN